MSTASSRCNSFSLIYQDASEEAPKNLNNRLAETRKKVEEWARTRTTYGQQTTSLVNSKTEQKTPTSRGNSFSDYKDAQEGSLQNGKVNRSIGPTGHKITITNEILSFLSWIPVIGTITELVRSVFSTNKGERNLRLRESIPIIGSLAKFDRQMKRDMWSLSNSIQDMKSKIRSKSRSITLTEDLRKRINFALTSRYPDLGDLSTLLRELESTENLPEEY